MNDPHVLHVDMEAQTLEYDGVRSDLSHMAPSAFASFIVFERTAAAAGMRPPALSVVVEGRDVTKRPELWPATERFYRGPGRLELVDP